MGLYDLSVGALLLGVFINTFLYGLVSYQFAAYHSMKFDDPRVIKCMVLFLFILDTFHSASAIYLAWYYVVTNYDNPRILETTIWPYQFTAVGTASAAFTTQIYLGFRIWRLTASKILYSIVIVLAVSAFSLGAGCSMEGWIIHRFSDLPRIRPIAVGWLAMQLAVDIFISVTLTIVFSRSRTGFLKTDTVLNRLMRGAIQTGLFIGTFSLGNLISFIVLPDTYLYAMFSIPIGRIYTNTLLDTLLVRRTIRVGISNMTDVRITEPRSIAPTDSLQVNAKHLATNIELEPRHSDLDICGHSPTDDEEFKGSVDRSLEP